MSSSHTPRVDIDRAAGVAYIKFSEAKVARTVEVVEDEIILDLDEYAMAVGIEVLDFDAEMPFQRLITEFHVPTEQVALLRLIRPNMETYVGSISIESRAATSRRAAALPC